jgi:hypothetical protein
MGKNRHHLNLNICLAFFLSDFLIYLILVGVTGWSWVLLVPMPAVATIAVLFMGLLLYVFPDLVPDSDLHFPTNLTLPTLSVAVLVTLSVLFLTRSPSIVAPHRIQIVAGLWHQPLLGLMSWVLKVFGLSLMVLWRRGQRNRKDRDE